MYCRTSSSSSSYSIIHCLRSLASTKLPLLPFLSLYLHVQTFNICKYYETYEQGESVAQYVDGLEGHDRVKTKLAHIGTHALLKMLLEVDEAFTFWGTPEGDLIHPAECMQQLLEKVQHHKVDIDGNVCTVMFTMLVLEGWQRKLDPRYNVMQTLWTLLLKVDWAKSLSYTIDGLMSL